MKVMVREPDVALSATDLINALAGRGVHHLRTVQKASANTTINDKRLIVLLAGHPEPRFRQALIALFLRQPSYAPLVPELVTGLSLPAQEVLRHMYTAAVYLQRLWCGTLGIYLADMSPLPDYFGRSDYHLPDPNDHFGEAGLRALAHLFHKKTGYDWKSVYDSVITLLLDQLRLEYQNGPAAC